MGKPSLLIVGLRWFLGLLFVFSGLAKLIPGFPNSMGPADLEHRLAPHGLALFARFIAVSEVGAGLLLLTRRFATIGALMLVPILVSIIVITTALHWRGTPYVVGVFLLMTLVLVWHDRAKLLPLIDGGAGESAGPSVGEFRSQFTWLAIAGVVLVGLGVVRVAWVSAASALAAVLLLTGLIVADWRQWPR